MTVAWGTVAAATVLGYLLGSIPFGLILARIAGHGDIRHIGSGNIGATNVLRTGDKKLAALTLALDMAKGAAAVLVAARWGEPAAIAAAAGAVLGHLYPAWLGFKGGKGVATALGVLLALAWPVGLACCATWLCVALALRYSSLAALLALALAPAYAWLIADDRMLALFAVALAALVWFKHRANIERLIGGREPRIF